MTANVKNEENSIKIKKTIYIWNDFFKLLNKINYENTEIECL